MPAFHQRMIAIAVTGMALPMTAPASAQSAADPQVTLQQVIVTAQKRKEDLQKTPVAVSVVSAGTMDRLQISDVSTLVEAVPGLQYSFSYSNPQLTIRGLTNYSNGPWVEPGVNTYVDGVYQANNQSSVLLFNDVAQVEVLKGPQGTLFGRNALAGVVSITTRTPSHDPSVDADVGYGNFNTVSGKFYGTTGITDSLAADLSVYVQKQNDGWGTNLYDNSPLHTGEQQAYRSKWVLTPSDATTVTFIGDYSHAEPQVLGLAPINGVFSSVTIGPVHPGGFYDSYLPNPGEFEVTQYDGSLKVEHDLTWAQIVSITGASWGHIEKNATTPAIIPFDPQNPSQGQATAGLQLNALQLIHTKTYTEELQLKSLDSSAIKWIAGVFLLSNKIDNAAYRLPVPGTLTTTLDDEDIKSYAGFGQATIPVTTDTRLTLGARYTSDHADVGGNSYSAAGVLIPGSSVSTNPQPSAVWNKPTWTVILDHDFSQRIMGYASYSRGYQSGSYNISSSVNKGPGDPQIMDAFELGLKTSSADNRLRANTSVFYYKIRDLLVSQNIAGKSVMSNAAAARIDGADLEIDWLPLDSLMLTAGVSYTDPIYSSYDDATRYEPNPNGNGTFVTITGDASGNQLVYSEKLSASLSASYTFHTATGDFALSAIENYHSGAHYDPQGLLVAPSYSVVNTSLDWALPGDSWDVKLWSNNLANTKYATLFANTPVMYMNPAPPRTYGIQFGYHWKK
jgi:iron complex outermembrane receptor protein